MIIYFEVHKKTDQLSLLYPLPIWLWIFITFSFEIFYNKEKTLIKYNSYVTSKWNLEDTGSTFFQMLAFPTGLHGVTTRNIAIRIAIGRIWSFKTKFCQ
jgi:hypothetical protein